MATETKSKKRKVAPEDEVANVRKVRQMTSEGFPKKRKVIGDEEPATTKKPKAPKLDPARDDQVKTTKKSDLKGAKSPAYNGNIATAKKSKTPKEASAAGKEVPDLNGSSYLTGAKGKQGKSKKLKAAQVLLTSDVEDDSTTDDSEEEEVDDQTNVLLQGFESDDDDEKDPANEGYEAGEEIPKIDKKIRAKSKAAAKASTSNEPGVVYVGRIPHGFYEQEMKQYFSQFGDISNLRLSRNRKTGSSKHFAFIEFKSSEVAEIVSKTMDNYLLFGHILKCKPVAKEQIHKDLWLGANKRFKKVPWNKLEGRKLQQGATEEKWSKRIEKEEGRRAQKKDSMKLIDYEFKSPKLKSVKDIPKKTQPPLTAAIPDESNGEDTEPKMIEAQHKPQTGAGVAKNKAKKIHSDPVQEPLSEGAEKAEGFTPTVDAPSQTKKAKKSKKRQSGGNANDMSEAKLGSDEALTADASEKVVKVEKIEKIESVKKNKKGKKDKST